MRAKLPSRQGLAIVPAFICLVLVTILCGVLLKLAATHRVLVRAEERKTQADWLAEAGLSRAQARLSATPDYRGETWEIDAKELAGRFAGIVRISVEPNEKSAKGRLIRIEADYPRGDALRARSSKTIHLNPTPDSSGGSS